jgi:lipoprotein-releasing system ATP-binding protein
VKVLEVQNVSKSFSTPAGDLTVLRDVSLKLRRGDSISIVGPSGSGKSSLLYILGALEPPSSGSIILEGQNPQDFDDRRLSLFRNRKIGFVFQEHHLLPQCDVLENVLVPTLVDPDAGESERRRAVEFIEQVGLGPRIHHRPHQLSGGEKQRVAIARALIREPGLLLCDEPTGNLDHESAETVASLLLEMHRKQKNVLILVTHNLDLAGRFKFRYRLSDGRLELLPGGAEN